MLFLHDLCLDLELALTLLIEILGSYATLIRTSSALFAQVEGVLSPALEKFLAPEHYRTVLSPADKHYFSLLRLVLLDYAPVKRIVPTESAIGTVRSTPECADGSLKSDGHGSPNNHGSIARLLELLSTWLSSAHPNHTRLALELLADIFPSILTHESFALLLQATISLIQQHLNDGANHSDEDDANMQLALQIIFSLFETLGNMPKVAGKSTSSAAECSWPTTSADRHSYAAAASLATTLIDRGFVGDAENRLFRTLCVMGFCSPGPQTEIEALWVKWIDTCISDALFAGADMVLEVVEIAHSNLSPWAWLRVHILYLTIKRALVEGATVPRQLGEIVDHIYGRPEIISHPSFFVSFAGDLLGALLSESSSAEGFGSATGPLRALPPLPSVIFEDVLLPLIFGTMLPLQHADDGWILLARSIFVEMVILHPSGHMRDSFFAAMVEYLTKNLPSSLARALEVIAVVMESVDDEVMLSATIALAFQLVDDGYIAGPGEGCQECCWVGPWPASTDTCRPIDAAYIPALTNRLFGNNIPSCHDGPQSCIDDLEGSFASQTEGPNAMSHSSIDQKTALVASSACHITATSSSISCSWGRLLSAIKALLLRVLEMPYLCALVERKLVPLLTTISQNDALSKLAAGHCAELISSIALVLHLPTIELNTQITLLGLLWTVSDEILSRIANSSSTKTKAGASSNNKTVQTAVQFTPQKTVDGISQETAVVDLQLHLYGALAEIAAASLRLPVREGAFQMLFRAISLHQRQGTAHWTAIFERILIPLLWRLPAETKADGGSALVLVGVEGIIDIFVIYAADLQSAWISTILQEIFVPVMLNGSEKMRLALLGNLVTFVTSIGSTIQGRAWRQKTLCIVFETWLTICDKVHEGNCRTTHVSGAKHRAKTAPQAHASKNVQKCPNVFRTDAMLEMVRVFREIFITSIGGDRVAGDEWEFLERLFNQGLPVLFSICIEGGFGEMGEQTIEELHRNYSPAMQMASRRLRDAVLRVVASMIDFLLQISVENENTAVKLGRALSLWHLNLVQRLVDDPIVYELVVSLERLLNEFGQVYRPSNDGDKSKEDQNGLCGNRDDRNAGHRFPSAGTNTSDQDRHKLALVRGLHCHVLGTTGAFFIVLMDGLQRLSQGEPLRSVTFNLLRLLLSQIAQILRWMLDHGLGPSLTGDMGEALFDASTAALRAAVDATSEREEELLVTNLDLMVVDSEEILGKWISKTCLHRYLSMLVRCITFAPAPARHKIGVFRERLALRALDNLVAMMDGTLRHSALAAIEIFLTEIENASTAPQVLAFSTLPAERYANIGNNFRMHSVPFLISLLFRLEALGAGIDALRPFLLALLRHCPDGRVREVSGSLLTRLLKDKN